MKLIEKITQGDLTGSLYLEKLGYTYKIKARVAGKMLVVGRSYVYILHKDVARQQMLDEMEIISGQVALFNLKDYQKPQQRKEKTTNEFNTF